MVTMNRVKKSSKRHTALGELKARLHKLIAAEIRGDVFDLAAIANRTHGLPLR